VSVTVLFGVAPPYVNGATATCPVGKVVLGGGLGLYSVGQQPQLMDTYPAGNNGWTAHIWNLAEGTPFTVYAICAIVGP
jgi:hypothetical protein